MGDGAPLILFGSGLELCSQLSLDMLNIKVWLDGLRVEITVSIPVEDVDVVTKSS